MSRLADPLSRAYLCARTVMENGRPRQVVRAVLSGRQLQDADLRLRRLTASREAWLCLRELSAEEADALTHAPEEVLWRFSSLATD